MAKEYKDTFTMAELAKVLGIKLIDPMDWGFDISGYYDYHIKQGLSEEEAQEKAEEEANEELDEHFDNYCNAVEEVFETYFGYVNLDVIRTTAHGPDWGYSEALYKLQPQKDWKDSLKLIIEIINGVGYFHFNSVKELLDSGPYTPKEAVLSHIGYVSEYGDVYGEASPSRMLQRSTDRLW